MTKPTFHRLRVSDVRPETRDAISISFAVPEELSADYAFRPGQFLTLRSMFDSKDVRRSYSICSENESELRIAVKKIENGLFSNWLADKVKPGDALDVMTPSGRFGVSDGGANPIHVGFAAGSGITPIISIARDVLRRRSDSQFFLFYGNKRSDNIIFKRQLEDLKDHYLARFSFTHVLTGEDQDFPIFNGRMTGEKVLDLLKSVGNAGDVGNYYICGPSEMNESIVATLNSIGIVNSAVHVERFISNFDGKPRANKSAEPAPQEKADFNATLIVDGKMHSIPLKRDESVLDAAIGAGLDLPFACRGGMCSTCRAKLVKGAVEMDVNYSLEPWEIESGFILTCQAHATTPHIVIDFDEL